MTSLFRREAVEHRQQGWLGTVQLVRPVSLTVLTVLVAAAALGVGALLVEGHYTRKARVSGFLVPEQGVIRIVPPQAGTVLESHAAEGREVRAGEVLFVLAIDQPTAGGETLQGSVDTRVQSLKAASRQQQMLEQSQAAALDRRIDEMRREASSRLAETELLEQRLALAEQAQTRLLSLRDENFVSPAQVQAKAEELLGVRAQLEAAVRERNVHQREIGMLEAQRRELPLFTQARRGEIDRELAQLSQQTAEKQGRQRLVIRAAHDGIVSAVLAGPGQSVSPAAPLASLVPAQSRLQAHLFAPSSAVGFLRERQPVMLRFEAFPFQKFGHQRGEVLQVSRAPLQAAELSSLPLHSGAGSQPLYRVTVALERQTVAAYGQLQPLSPGMQIEGDVQLDRRRLIEWIFEPVLGLAGRV